MSTRKSTSIKLARIFKHSDPCVLPPWDDIAKCFPVGSAHIGAVTRVTETGVFGTIEFDKNEIPFFLDMKSLMRECGPPDLGDLLAVRVASLNEASREIKFIAAT